MYVDAGSFTGLCPKIWKAVLKRPFWLTCYFCLNFFQILEELENLEETLNESIRESLGARVGKLSHGKKKGATEEDEELLRYFISENYLRGSITLDTQLLLGTCKFCSVFFFPLLG